MRDRICVLTHLPRVPEGGYLWISMNWVMGLRSLGCPVIWAFHSDRPPDEHVASLRRLEEVLAPYGLQGSLAFLATGDAPLPGAPPDGWLGLADAVEAELVLVMGHYAVPARILRSFRRAALIDIDPGLFQLWVSKGWLPLAAVDIYFTIGETVGRPAARFPDLGVSWEYTPPCVALDCWPPSRAARDVFTTISHWWGESMEDVAGNFYPNDKRAGFLPFIDLPRLTTVPLELALTLGADEDEHRLLLEHGWRVTDGEEVSRTPLSYHQYIQASRGEFSCVKPSCVLLENAWVSDRTLCYLASGKPAVVQHTGRSRFLPDAEGMFRFKDLGGATRSLAAAAADYDRHARQARALAEAYFDARAVVARVLERALP